MGLFLVVAWLALLAGCYSQGNKLLVISPEPEVIIPSGMEALTMTHILFCGIVEDTQDYSITWTTPNEESITTSGATPIEQQPGGKFSVTNSMNTEFPRISSFIIMELTYLDSGNYTCSVTFTGGSENVGMTVAATIRLELLVSVVANVDMMEVMVGLSGSLSCHMADYIRPDSAFRWRKGAEMLTNNDRHNITYSEGSANQAQNGEANLVSSRVSTLTIFSVEEGDEGLYTCFVADTDVSADVQLNVLLDQTPPITTSTANPETTTAEAENEGSSFPLPAVGAIAAFLGIIVVILIVLIVIVSCRKRRKSSAVRLEHPPERELNENTAYDSTSNGGAIHGGGLPKYARIDRPSSSPPPPLPARPSTNMSSANSLYEFDTAPPGYETPLDVTTSAEKSTTIDPYYDNPDDVVKPAPPLPNAPKKKRTYYDEIEFGDDQPFSPRENGIAPVVPSPAVILSGSLQRNTMNQHSPDFSYPTYNEEDAGDNEHDYDQIYSEPLDPTMLRHDYELEGSHDMGIPYSAIYDDPQPLHDTAPLRVTPGNIVEIKRLGMGQFGNVILARTVGLSMKDLKFSETDTDTNKSTLVAIKKLKNDADGGLMETFEKEVKFMARLNHDNVIRLLSICTTGESFIMMEYMENGDLNQFLQKQILMPDTIAGLQDFEVTPIILLYIGVQIASGMHYLGSHRFVHRDLATRNCLVGRDFVVKISDFGMSRSLYESAYYRVQGTLILPIRWMACETFYGKFSMKSDAWAFGVVLWEIYTLGKVDPYDNMTDEEVIADAIRGPDRRVLEKPLNCPQDVYDIMLRCWVHEPSMRADFGEIYSRLFMIYTRQAL